MNRLAYATVTAFALALAGCPETAPDAAQPLLRLARTPDGRVAVELVDSPSSVRALQVELSVNATSSFTLDEPQGPAGVPIDTVRMAMRGTNRAILFAGDGRGVTLPRSGTLATFSVRPAGGSGLGALSIVRAVVVSSVTGETLELRYGPAISVR